MNARVKTRFACENSTITLAIFGIKRLKRYIKKNDIAVKTKILALSMDRKLLFEDT